MKSTQDWVNRSIDGAAVAAGDEHLSHGRDDQHGRFLPDLVQRDIDGGDAEVVDDLCRFHAGTRRDVERGHVTANVGITDYGEHGEPKLHHSGT